MCEKPTDHAVRSIPFKTRTGTQIRRKTRRDIELWPDLGEINECRSDGLVGKCNNKREEVVRGRP